MKYSIVIEPSSNTQAWSVVALDAQVLFGGRLVIGAAIENAKEAISLWIDIAIDEDKDYSKLQQHYRFAK